jgi:hypothetical protein
MTTLYLLELLNLQNASFEGKKKATEKLPAEDSTVPTGAQIIVNEAKLTLAPGNKEHSNPKEDSFGISFMPKSPKNYAYADLSVPREISGVNFTCTKCSAVSVQIDMGGNYMGIAPDGTLLMPSGPDSEPQPKLLLEADTWVDSLRKIRKGSETVPSLTTSKLKLTAAQLNGAEDLTNAEVKITSITLRSSPSNLTLSFGQDDPVPIHLGPLISEITVDVTTALNNYLAEAKPEKKGNHKGKFLIPITLQSATLGRLTTASLDIDYDIKVSAFHPGLSELNLTYGYDGTPLESASSAANDPYALSVLIPKGATVKAARAKLQGEFDETRIARATPKIFDFTDDHYIPIPFRHLAAVAVSPTPSSETVQTLAQSFQVEKNTQLTAIDLLVDSDIAPHSILNLALQADDDGIPSGNVLTSTVITIEKSLEEHPPWVSAILAKPFFLNGKKPDGTHSQRYWLVLQVQEGKGRWYTAKTNGTAWNLISSQDNGFSWQSAEVSDKKLMAAFRLRHCPKQFQVPVQLQIGNGQPLKLSEFNPLGRVDFEYDFTAALGKALGDDKQDNHDVKLCFFSEAPGKLTLSEVDVDYQLKGE